ncbi:MAG: ribosome modulation factor [Porticoccaceae bacterium]|nr:ribosome modulation factor [Porticoccaceae bacterium]
MRSQKRDAAHRAFLRGYQTGYDMKSKSLCPYQAESNLGQEWLRGWREGRQDQWQGFNAQACQQKVSAM